MRVKTNLLIENMTNFVRTCANNSNKKCTIATRIVTGFNKPMSIEKQIVIDNPS